MGHYEPAPKHTKPAKKKAPKALVGLLSVMTLVGAAQQGENYLPRISFTKPFVQTVPNDIVSPPQLAATETAQGTAPLADGLYIQYTTTNPAQTAQQLQQLNIPTILEPVENKNRLLIPYTVEEFSSILPTLRLADKTGRVLLLEKENGQDTFRRYAPRTNDPHLRALEDYCIAAQGKIERMPYYDAMREATTIAMRDDNMATYGFTEKSYLYRAYAIGNTESGLDQNATSPAGAKGIMQLTDGTVHWLFGEHKVLSPHENILAGAKHYNLMHRVARNEMGVKNIEQGKNIALKAYNAGAGNIKRGKEFTETTNYLIRVKKAEHLMRTYFP